MRTLSIEVLEAIVTSKSTLLLFDPKIFFFFFFFWNSVAYSHFSVVH